MQVVVAALLFLGNTVWVAARRGLWQARYKNPRTGDPTPERLLFGGLIASGGTVTFYLAVVPLPGAVGASLMAVASLGWVNAVVDAHCRKLPTAVTRLLYAEVFACVLAAVITGVPVDWQHLAAGALLWVIPPGFGYLFKRQVGLGDVIFAPILGLWLGLAGLGAAVVGIVAAVFAVGAWSVFLLLVTRGQGDGRVPFGPFLWGGAIFSAAVFFVRTTSQLAAGCGKLCPC